MKLSKALINLTMLTVILLSVGVVIVLSGGRPRAPRVTCDPSTYSLDTPAPDEWKATISGRSRRAEIDPSTILLEGVYEPVSTYSSRRRGVYAYFDGDIVKHCLMIKCPHLAPGVYHIGLEITGELTDGTTFSCTGYIDVTVPNVPPPI